METFCYYIKNENDSNKKLFCYNAFINFWKEKCKEEVICISCTEIKDSSFYIPIVYDFKFSFQIYCCDCFAIASRNNFLQYDGVRNPVNLWLKLPPNNLEEVHLLCSFLLNENVKFLGKNFLFDFFNTLHKLKCTFL